MVRSERYDCRVVREDKQETDEPPLFQQIDEEGSLEGKRVKRGTQWLKKRAVMKNNLSIATWDARMLKITWQSIVSLAKS